MQYYCYLYFNNRYIFGKQTVWQMILDQMAGGIPQIHSAAIDFILSEILIHYGYLQMF
jgi:hypothetical protein